MKGTILSLLFLTGLWSDFTRIYDQNQIIQSAYDAYIEDNFDQTESDLSTLIDSLGMEDVGLKLNRAHTSYKKNGFSGPTGINFSKQADSLFLQRVQATFYHYTKLWETEKEMASIGYNQSGLVTFKSRVVNNKIAEDEQLIQSAMDYFKVALRKDPYNDEARYNYEVLKKFKEFPNIVMARVREMVRQRRYTEAFIYLGPFAEKDKRFTQYVDYAKRLGDIVKIENPDDES